MVAAFEINTFPCGGTALAAFDVNPLPFEALAAFETNTYTCGGTALAAFHMITFPCGGTAFDINPLPFKAGRHWCHLRLTHTLVAGRLWGHFR